MFKAMAYGVMVAASAVGIGSKMGDGSPTPPTNPSIADINAGVPALCDAIDTFLASGSDPVELVLGSQAYYAAQYPDSDPFVEGYVYGIIVGCMHN